MDELVRLVSQRTGIPEGTARTAVETVIGYIKERLPAPIAAQVDNVIAKSGATGAAGGATDDIAGKLGGIFGGDKS